MIHRIRGASLSAAGQLDAAARLLCQAEAPSWRYPVTAGATTVWERWDALLPDGSVNPHEMTSVDPHEMTSFHHYVFGAVVDWLHRGPAGLAPAEPGYRRLRIAPTVLPGLTHARSEQLTPYGRREGERRVDGQGRQAHGVGPRAAPHDRRSGPPRRSPTGRGSGAAQLVAVLPRAARPIVEHDLDTDLADLVDDPEALGLVRATLEEHAPDRARAFDGAIRHEAGSTLRTALLFAEPAALAAVDRALADLHRHRPRLGIAR